MIWEKKGKEMKKGAFLLYGPTSDPYSQLVLIVIGLVTDFYHLDLANNFFAIQALLLGSSYNLDFLLALFFLNFITSFFYLF